VVSVVLDQIGSWVLERHLPKLRADGAIRRAIAEGTYVRRARYGYAGTYTAPGHATIYTGRYPEGSGVGMNRGIVRHGREKTESIVEDHEHLVFGARDGVTASPALMQADGVADVLLRETAGRARVVSVSMKDRGAVIPGGRRPTMAVWYDEHARAFTTSTHYANARPAWLERFNRERPVTTLFTVWNPLDVASLRARSTPDDAEGEGDWKGLGRTFPHDLARASDPYSALLATPQSSEWLFELAARAADEYQLGRDDTPDLLAISVSSTDYVGHVFGAESWEAEDNLLRCDLALARLLARLEREGRGPIALLITADHGVARLPEASRAEGREAHRLDWDALPERLNAALDARFDRALLGASDAGIDPFSSDVASVPRDASVAERDANETPSRLWAEAFVQPYIFLTGRARASSSRDRIVAAAIEALRAMPGVHAAYDVREADRLRGSNDPIERAVGESIPRRATYELGDIFVVPAERSLVDERMPRGFGTSHGSPWEYDTDVPVIVRGPGVPRAARDEVVSMRRVAATIAALLRVTAPNGEQSLVSTSR
jgi:arylsulfatase A-like enzyme